MPSNSNINSEAPDRARGPSTSPARTDHPPRFNAESPITPLDAAHYLNPEAAARIEIDEMLEAAGWAVQDYRAMALGAARA